VLAFKPNKLSSIPGSHMVKGKSQHWKKEKKKGKKRKGKERKKDGWIDRYCLS
jgi:hypothetical protein